MRIERDKFPYVEMNINVPKAKGVSKFFKKVKKRYSKKNKKLVDIPRELTTFPVMQPEPGYVIFWIR